MNKGLSGRVRSTPPYGEEGGMGLLICAEKVPGYGKRVKKGRRKVSLTRRRGGGVSFGGEREDFSRKQGKSRSRKKKGYD